ncbi:unnamed protein product [Sphenostylis stenocarpa]|uniref:Uncharacterized protein n=1 Tax=Sphenostylis stenocarpa TaxID=92480 RepID=A0AA86SV26_9FABA|nr:unnamed protein product [Sphenostylis stenocarpa]
MVSWFPAWAWLQKPHIHSLVFAETYTQYDFSLSLSALRHSIPHAQSKRHFGRYIMETKVKHPKQNFKSCVGCFYAMYNPNKQPHTHNTMYRIIKPRAAQSRGADTFLASTSYQHYSTTDLAASSILSYRIKPE